MPSRAEVSSNLCSNPMGCDTANCSDSDTDTENSDGDNDSENKNKSMLFKSSQSQKGVLKVPQPQIT